MSNASVEGFFILMVIECDISCFLLRLDNQEKCLCAFFWFEGNKNLLEISSTSANFKMNAYPIRRFDDSAGQLVK